MQQLQHAAPTPAQTTQFQQSPPEDNALIKAANPLLTLITHIKHTIDHPNVSHLRAQIIEEIKRFEHHLRAIHTSERVIIASRYCLCTAMDEAVLGRPWGTQSVWIQDSLLNYFHKETWGGERFYIILEDMSKNLRKNIDFLELIYFLLSLGFEGKFHDKQHASLREEIRNRLIYRIHHARKKPERILSRRWKNTETLASDKDKRKKLRHLIITSLVIIGLIGLFFNIKLYRTAEPTLTKLSNIATVPSYTIFGQVIGRDIIKRDNHE